MQTNSILRKLKYKLLFSGLLIVAMLIIILAAGGPHAWAQISPLHPTFPLMDKNGINVLESGEAVSTMQTCGACHDADFIESHSYHADVGLGDLTNPGQTSSARAWDTSPGFFGKWNPLTYRYLSPSGDDRIDLGTAAWIQSIGIRHVGGGPAVYSRAGMLLTELPIAADDPETHVVDQLTGALTTWDWNDSGVVEMNCFLCHISEPNNTERMETLHAGEFEWANSATLLGTGIIEKLGERWEWNQDVFDENGELREDYITIQDPDNDNCGQCHGLVHADVEFPLATTGCQPDSWTTATTGQIISPQRLSDSGMNLADKTQLTRAWDIHAERLLECTDCHFSLNNPVYFQQSESTSPEHLEFDPRRLEIGEYLYQPLHQFARGQSAQSTVAPEFNDSLRRCETCHAAETTHAWLPYIERHLDAIYCETCHIPKIYSNAFKQFDWTVITADGTARRSCRGLEGESGTFKSLITGYQPVVLARETVDGDIKLAPYNLVTAWFWVYGSPERPVRQMDLKIAWLDGEDYHPAVTALFDVDGSGFVEENELVLDSTEKVSLIATRLETLGLENPYIVGEIQPYSISHTVTNGEWVTRDCQTCHSEDSRLTRPFLLADYVPAGVIPQFVSDTNTLTAGDIYQTAQGEMYYQPSLEEQGVYVLGYDSVRGVDRTGALIFLGVLAGVITHSGVRVWTARRTPLKERGVKRVFMYSVYERLWHWLQTTAILILTFTGLIMHNPDGFRIFDFRYVVLVHNIIAFILAVNAFLALFYNLVSGDLRRFIPKPQGFFNQAIRQMLYYLRGMFRGEHHPFEKTREERLNPLQKITYIGILNVLLPLQGITGILIWGAQRWPAWASRFGGLAFLGPFHTLIAWLFASFIVLHVYLTTTGHTPLAGIQSMVFGWDELEVHSPDHEEMAET